MKQVVLLAMIAILCTGGMCQKDCNPGSEPGPPYGHPDKVSRYDGGDGYKSIDYTYYCKNGEYISVTYIRSDECATYHLGSEFRSAGVCGNEQP